MEISLWAVLYGAFTALGGFAGIVVLAIQLGKLFGWWSSAPAFADELMEALKDGTITAEEAKHLLETLAKIKG